MPDHIGDPERKPYAAPKANGAMKRGPSKFPRPMMPEWINARSDHPRIPNSDKCAIDTQTMANPSPPTIGQNQLRSLDTHATPKRIGAE